MILEEFVLFDRKLSYLDILLSNHWTKANLAGMVFRWFLFKIVSFKMAVLTHNFENSFQLMYSIISTNRMKEKYSQQTPVEMLIYFIVMYL
jgi:hypothetical protein